MNSESGVVGAGPTTAASVAARTPLYDSPRGAMDTLRVVLVIPRRMPAWLLRFFDLAADSEWLDLVVLPVDGEPPVAAAALPADLRALLRYERERTPGAAMTGVVVEGRDGVTFASAIRSGADTAALRAQVRLLQPDLVLLLGAPHWAEALGDRAQWGCWSLDPDFSDAGRAAQALLAPIVRGDVATAVQLQLHHLGRPPTTLVASWGSTCRESASVQRERAFRKVPALLMRALRRLASGELQVLQRRTARLQLAPETTSGVGSGLRVMARTLAGRWAARRRRARNREAAWHVVVRQGPQCIDPDAPDMPRHAFLAAPDPLHWADPWLVDDAGRRLLFVEQWTDYSSKGSIACVELLPDAQVRLLGIVLDQPFHLSYPQVFPWQGQWYLTVESAQAHCVSLYMAAEFPLRWQHVTDLVVGRTCVDPTLYRHEDRWYLFANVDESGGGTCDELFLFVADRLTGPFRPHPANPIVSDVRRARPAGGLFLREGRLIRPAQDCAPSYGAAVVFNEVLDLTATHYRERPLGRLDARWASGLDGCHTYNEAGGIEVLDARGTPPKDSARLRVRQMPLLAEPVGIPT